MSDLIEDRKKMILSASAYNYCQYRARTTGEQFFKMENKSKIMENPPFSYQDLLDKVQQYQDGLEYPKAIELLDQAIIEWKGVKNHAYASLLLQNAYCCDHVSEHTQSIELLEV
jgi:hypothetical protein